MHGTGTPLGDPIEVGALGQALGTAGTAPRGSRRRPSTTAPERALAMLSSKACFGHTEGGAGLAGLLLALQVRRPAPCSLWGFPISGVLVCRAVHLNVPRCSKSPVVRAMSDQGA